MRLVGSRVVPSVLLASALAALAAPAHADKWRLQPDPSITVVDNEPATSAARPAARRPTDTRKPADVGQRREITIVPPSTVPVDTGGAVSPEHSVAAPPAEAAPTESGDLVAELAARQLAKETRRHQRAIDACLAAAARRTPGAAGTVTLALEIADRKLLNVRVADDDVHDPALTSCLAHTARDFSFSLASAHISWPVTLTPAASR